MKKVVSALSMMSLAFSSDLKLGVSRKSIAGNENSYELSCEGARGQVKYSATGLPNGIKFNGSSLSISNQAIQGNYPIRVSATDSTGNTVEKIIILSVTPTSKQVGVMPQTRTQSSISSIGLSKNDKKVISQIRPIQPINGHQQMEDFNRNLQNLSFSQNGNLQNKINVQINGNKQYSQSNVQMNGNRQYSQPVVTLGLASQPISTNQNRLSNIVSTYSTTTQYTKPKYENVDRYPQPSFPSVPTQTGPNPTLYQISNSQAQRTTANRNTITSDDVALRAASERHQNSIKGITNLLRLIDQAKANKDKAQSNIQVYTQAYNDAITAQRNAQNQIISAQNTSSQIVSSINSLSISIDELRKKINDNVSQSEVLKKQKIVLTSSISVNESQKGKLFDKLKNLDDQVGGKVKLLSDKNSQLQTLQNSLVNKQKQLDKFQSQLSNIQNDRTNIVIDINNKTNVVDQLRKKLQQSQKQLADAKIKLSQIDTKRLALPLQILDLAKELQALQSKARLCNDEVTKIKDKIDTLKTQNIQGLTKQIGDLDKKLIVSKTAATEIDIKIANLSAPLADLQNKLSNAIEELSYLKNQKIQYQNTLRLAYQRGNDVNNRVAYARQNLDAIIKRFQDQSKILSDATLNLQKARAEESLARLGLQEMIAYYSNALPYAIVPNGNLSTDPGNPFGNNPSGSPLGQIKTNGSGASGSFKVNNWANYLSSAYGAGVNPAIIGSVNQLFPFNFLSTVTGNNVVNGYINLNQQTNSNNDCSRPRTDTSNQQIATGSIVKVNNDSFEVQTNDGKILKVNISPCTRLNSNKADYSMQYGDQAYVKGYIYETDRKMLDGVQVTCIR